jgi:Zn-dependent peptidase ImmA (M78 family)
MLFPDEAVVAELGKHRNQLSIQELGLIKQQYGISIQAIVMRARDCGVINEHYTRQFFFMIKQMNWRVDEPVDYEGQEQSNRFDQLLYRGLAEEQITWSKAASLKNMKLSEFKSQTPIFMA